MAKGHIFSSFAKLESAQRKLKAEVRKFNSKIEKAVTSGKIDKETAPERASYDRIMRYSVPAAGTAAEQTAAIKAATAALEEVQKAGALDVVKAGEASVTRYTLQQYKRAAEKARKGREDAKAEIERIKEHGAQVGGRSVVNVERLQEKARYSIPEPGKSTFLKTSGDFEKWAKRFEHTFFDVNVWENYRTNLAKNIRKHMSRADAKKMTNFLYSLTADQLQTLYDNKDQNKFISQDVYYDERGDAASYIAQAGRFLGFSEKHIQRFTE